jgi:hypothetical protein
MGTVPVIRMNVACRPTNFTDPSGPSFAQCVSSSIRTIDLSRRACLLAGEQVVGAIRSRVGWRELPR